MIYWLTLRTDEVGDFMEYGFPTRERAEKRLSRLQAIDKANGMESWCQYTIWEQDNGQA